MRRREFLKTSLVVLPSLSILEATSLSAAPNAPFRRARPVDPEWPSLEKWDHLRSSVEGRLVKVESPLIPCNDSSKSAACNEIFMALKNPYYIGDQVALTQTSGWADAWVSTPSVYAVAATKTADIVAAVNFARENNLRLVVKGGGHSYQGTSNSPDSLLIWTRAMHDILLHDSFVGQGCSDRGQPAVSLGAGAIWMQAYEAVTTKAGKYVQGGGCTTVGVAGLIQSGGFGSFSKHYGTAAAALLEAEVVTADGVVRIANACTNPELFWGIKGGGGGSLGVVTRVTLRTREIPSFFGGVFGTVKASSDASFRRLIQEVVGFYQQHLFNPQWGEQIIFEQGNSVRFSMVFHGLSREEAETVWQPLTTWINLSPDEFTFEKPFRVLEIPARRFWDVPFMKKNFPGAYVADDRPGAPEGNVFWDGDHGQVGHFLHGYRSAWLSSSLLKTQNQPKLADALFNATRHWGVSLHFNKGLAGAPPEEIIAAKNTATNPALLDAFALAIIAGNSQPAFPGIPGHEPDLSAARRDSLRINQSMSALLKVSKKTGSYVSESDFFELSWQQSFWGSNYPRLLAVKKKYDPHGLFFVHHGVGSESWSADGFERLR